MPRRSQAEVRLEVRNLQRLTNDQLFLRLSREANTSARHNTIVHGKAKSGRFSNPIPEAATVDSPMLRDLRSALHGEVSTDTGEDLFKITWRRLRRRICEDWNLCNKWQPNDTTLVVAIWAYLSKGEPVATHAYLLIVLVLAVRMGPEWMCGCSKKEKKREND